TLGEELLGGRSSAAACGEQALEGSRQIEQPPHGHAEERGVVADVLHRRVDLMGHPGRELSDRLQMARAPGVAAGRRRARARSVPSTVAVLFAGAGRLVNVAQSPLLRIERWGAVDD